jgi:hypothetical protein
MKVMTSKVSNIEATQKSPKIIPKSRLCKSVVERFMKGFWLKEKDAEEDERNHFESEDDLVERGLLSMFGRCVRDK